MRREKGPRRAARLRVFGAMWLATAVMTWPALQTPSAASDICDPSFTLTATAGATHVSLSWCEPELVDSYTIYEGTSQDSQPTQVNDTPLGATVTSYDVTGLTGGTTYYFKVEAFYKDVGNPSNVASATPTATAPGAPTALTATAGRSSVSLSWAAPDSDGGSAVTSYNVYQGTVTGGESKVPVISPASTSVTVTGLTNGTAYYFMVTAVNAVGESTPSGEVSTTPLQPGGDPSQGPSDGPSGGNTGNPGGGTHTGGGAHGGHHHHHATGRHHAQPSVSPAASSTHLISLPASLLVAAAAAVAALTLAMRRLRLRKRKPPVIEPRVQVKTDPGPPGKVTVLSTGWQPTVAARIVPDPGTSRTTIEERSR